MFVVGFIVVLLLPVSFILADVRIQIDLTTETWPISSLLYGVNQDMGLSIWKSRRIGGNRMTGYNWETNASNAGADWYHSSDNFMLSNSDIPSNQWNQPGVVITHFHDQSLAMNAYSLVTLEMAGYVARDMNGEVSEAETAPSSRWNAVIAKKPTPLSAYPSLLDFTVYMDEQVYFLTQTYGMSTDANGIRAYALDNEPALWSSTHSRIHPDALTCEELIQRSLEYASAIKDVDPDCEIFGPALYGMGAYATLQGAPDWSAVQDDYLWFIDYYLAEMKKVEDATGRRFLDVLDVHWYPEAQGDERITEGGTTPADNQARVQASRSLWDPNYVEDSWIGQYMQQYLPLIPKLIASVEQYYPGTKLAFTEFNWGNGEHVSDGIAITDVLGIFGQYGVYFSTLWGGGSESIYTQAAYRMFLDYNGQGGEFGNTGIHATTNDSVSTSVYASIHDGDATRLHLIAINKNLYLPTTLDIQISGSMQYTSATVYGFDSGSAQIQQIQTINSIEDNQFTFNMDRASVSHLVLEGAGMTGVFDSQLDAFPNPFERDCQLTFSVNNANRIRIFNAIGQSIRVYDSLENRESVTWDGRDQNGRIVADGIYLVQLESPAGHSTRKVTFIR